MPLRALGLRLRTDAAAKLEEHKRAQLRAAILRLKERAKTLVELVRAYAEEQGAKLGIVAQPLRAALTGRSTSPGIFDVLAVLGRDESLERTADQATGRWAL